jgi:hypothetical protein
MLDTLRLYYRWIEHLSPTRIHALLVAMPSIPLSYRKAILTWSRAQPYSLSGSRIEERFHQQLDDVIYIRIPHHAPEEEATFQPVTLRSLMKDIELDPVISYV